MYYVRGGTAVSDLVNKSFPLRHIYRNPHFSSTDRYRRGDASAESLAGLTLKYCHLQCMIWLCPCYLKACRAEPSVGLFVWLQNWLSAIPCILQDDTRMERRAIGCGWGSPLIDWNGMIRRTFREVYSSLESRGCHLHPTSVVHFGHSLAQSTSWVFKPQEHPTYMTNHHQNGAWHKMQLELIVCWVSMAEASKKPLSVKKKKTKQNKPHYMCFCGNWMSVETFKVISQDHWKSGEEGLDYTATVAYIKRHVCHINNGVFLPYSQFWESKSVTRICWFTLLFAVALAAL